MTVCSVKPAECIILLKTLQLSPVAFRFPLDYCVFFSCLFVFTVGKNDGSVNGKKYFTWWVFNEFPSYFSGSVGLLPF